jgi:hypothetical protein
MALPNSNISVAMVKAELGAATNDVGQLCIHANVNKWSKRKPINHSSVVPLTEAQFAALKYGINIFELPSTVGSSYNTRNWAYNKPTSLSPKRLTDFCQYEKSAPVPLIQNHGTGEIVFAKFVNVNTNIMFNTPRTPTALQGYCLNIENIATEGGDVIAGNYYLAADIYPRGASSGTPLATLYSLQKIGYSTGTYNEDARSIRLSEPSLPSGNYEYHLYISTHNETVPLGESRKNYPINWTSAYPNKINMSVKALAEQFTINFVGIMPASGSWPDGTTSTKIGALQNYGNGSSDDFGTLRNFIARFKITNSTGQTVYIPRSSLRVNYNYQNVWTDASPSNTYGSVATGGDIIISNGASVYFNSGTLRLFPINIPSGSIDITVFPNFKLYYFNEKAQVDDPNRYEPFYHNPAEPAVSLRFTN